MPLNNDPSQHSSALPEQSKSHPVNQSNSLPLTFVPTLLEIWRQEGRQHWIRTQGTSMLPCIREGDNLLLSYNLTAIRRGSIIVFSQEGRLIAHRVIRILSSTPPCFITKGDNSWKFDTPISVHELIGQILIIQRQDSLIKLNSAKWQMIGWLTATATLAVAQPYSWLRHVKQKLWGSRQLPGVLILLRCTQIVIRTVLKPSIRSSSQNWQRRHGERTD